jgi:hypothetical protein
MSPGTETQTLIVIVQGIHDVAKAGGGKNQERNERKGFCRARSLP